MPPLAVSDTSAPAAGRLNIGAAVAVAQDCAVRHGTTGLHGDGWPVAGGSEGRRRVEQAERRVARRHHRNRAGRLDVRINPHREHPSANADRAGCALDDDRRGARPRREGQCGTGQQLKQTARRYVGVDGERAPGGGADRSVERQRAAGGQGAVTPRLTDGQCAACIRAVDRHIAAGAAGDGAGDIDLQRLEARRLRATAAAVKADCAAGAQIERPTDDVHEASGELRTRRRCCP